MLFRRTCGTNGKANAKLGCALTRNLGPTRSRANTTSVFPERFERWLDAGHGACLLRRPDCAKVVAETLRHFEGERVVMISAVVMPNHVHALFVQNPEWPLEKLIRSWKGFSARKINALLGRSGGLWQRDYFDRLVRDEKHFANCVRYIRRNPEKARLTAQQFVLWESEIAKAIA